MGPLVSDEQYRKVVGYIESGIAEGAKIAAGGPVSGFERGYFVRPTVLTNTNPRMKVVQEEIFGPVVCAVPFSDDELDRSSSAPTTPSTAWPHPSGRRTSAWLTR